MTLTQFRRFTPDALLSHASIASDEALALASSPGGCEGNRYPVFVELGEAEVAACGYTRGSHLSVEFILPGKPGRWRAAGEVTMVVDQPRPDAPLGVGVELLGLSLTGEPAAAAAEEAPVEEPEVVVEAFDASTLSIELTEVAGMLADLLGRDVTGEESEALTTKITAHDVAAAFRDDSGLAAFMIVFDKAGAARIGGSLTMLPADGINADVEKPDALEGEALENAGEVLNIMSALFHEAGAQHVVLAETVTGEELPEACDGELQAIVDAPTWSLSMKLEIEEYGPAEVLLLAK